VWTQFYCRLPCAVEGVNVNSSSDLVGENANRLGHIRVTGMPLDVSSFLITHSQAAKLTQPSECSIYHPPPSAQPAAVRSVSLRQTGHDVACAQTPTDCLSVISTIA